MTASGVELPCSAPIVQMTAFVRKPAVRRNIHMNTGCGPRHKGAGYCEPTEHAGCRRARPIDRS
jgi:hypothetical protein